MATTQTCTRETAGGLREARNFVGGRWVSSTTAEWQDVTNPALGRPIARVPLSTPAEVDAAVRVAQDAFPAWRRTPPLTRARYMFALKQIMERRFDDLARAVTEEHGKTLDDARGSVRRAIENVEVASGITTLMMGYGLEDGAASGIDESVIRQPLGVFAAICPFNFPAMVPFWFWPYAVATGNTYVIKPSEQVPMTMQVIFELLEEAGFPPGVVNLVNGGKGVVDALLDHPTIRGISFVGSTPVARYIYERAAANGKRVQAQGGAKNHLVIMPDAVIDACVPNLLGSCFGAAGQRCLAGSAIITVGDVHQRFMDALVAGAKALKIGNGMDPDVELGPVVSAKARERILGYIDVGVQEGARLVMDGRGATVPAHEDGYFVGPTIFDDVKPSMRIAREEIFGPVVSVMNVPSLDAAIDVIENIPLGNAASIYTQSGKAAREFRYRVNCGNIGVNIGVAAPMAYFPFSGWKQSFFGTQHGQGRDAVDFFTDKKVYIERWL